MGPFDQVFYDLQNCCVTLIQFCHCSSQSIKDDKTFNCLAQNEAGAKLSSVDLIVNKGKMHFRNDWVKVKQFV